MHFSYGREGDFNGIIENNELRILIVGRLGALEEEKGKMEKEN
jgi:hypothetical protein